jgi:hypothetical protein
MHQEETSEIEPEPLESQPVGSTTEPSPELKPETLEEEDSLPPEFLRSIKYDLFEDFGNTSLYTPLTIKYPSILKTKARLRSHAHMERMPIDGCRLGYATHLHHSKGA